jgi:hypothetical protein
MGFEKKLDAFRRHDATASKNASGVFTMVFRKTTFTEMIFEKPPLAYINHL